jgi:hypothetical protein
MDAADASACHVACLHRLDEGNSLLFNNPHATDRRKKEGDEKLRPGQRLGEEGARQAHPPTRPPHRAPNPDLTRTRGEGRMRWMESAVAGAGAKQLSFRPAGPESRSMALTATVTVT